MSAPTKAPTALPAVIAAKLTAFDSCEDAFMASFRLAQQMQGQIRFAAVPPAATAGYLHALWVCECKDRLLSIPKTIARFEGQRALELLLVWQETGAIAGLVAFLQERLDMLSFADITGQMEDAQQRAATEPEQVALAQRLAHGRIALLNRLVHLHLALDALFALTRDELQTQAREACVALGHTPAAIRKQLAQFDTPLHAYVPHPALARRNMLVMNALGVQVTDTLADHPGERTPAVAAPTMPIPSYAEECIIGEHESKTGLSYDPEHARLPTPPSREESSGRVERHPELQ
ncbi:MAG: hypothetical protein ABI068_03790 [Ktedonobacterales bacterium]